MNILGLYLLNQIRTGGDRRYLDLMESLAGRGNNVFIIMNSFFDYVPRYFTKIDLTVKYVRHRPPPASYLFKKNIKKAIERIQEKLKSYGVSSPDFILNFGDTHLKASLFLKNYLNTPLFYGFRCNDIDRAHILRSSGELSLREFISSLVIEPVNRFREKQIAKFADLITFQNSTDMNRFFLRTHCSESKTVVIPGNIGPPRFTGEWENRNNASGVKKIIYVGSLSSGKGLWDLLKAIKLLKDRGYIFLRCYILGRKENSKLTMRLIEKLGIGDLLSIEGYKDPFPYLAECDLMIYPTRYDAFPNTVLESIHVGCPVLAAAIGGVPDILKYDQLLFEPANIQEIAEKIERCIKDIPYYQNLRKLCSERALAHHFDWAEQFEKAMIGYYEGRSVK
jgi:glycosyltransferase involved in cell wall biosynthesis